VGVCHGRAAECQDNHKNKNPPRLSSGGFCDSLVVAQSAIAQTPPGHGIRQLRIPVLMAQLMVAVRIVMKAGVYGRPRSAVNKAI
jgi:hypothetical protein